MTSTQPRAKTRSKKIATSSGDFTITTHADYNPDLTIKSQVPWIQYSIPYSTHSRIIYAWLPAKYKNLVQLRDIQKSVESAKKSVGGGKSRSKHVSSHDKEDPTKSVEYMVRITGSAVDRVVEIVFFDQSVRETYRWETDHSFFFDGPPFPLSAQQIDLYRSENTSGDGKANASSSRDGVGKGKGKARASSDQNRSVSSDLNGSDLRGHDQKASASSSQKVGAVTGHEESATSGQRGSPASGQGASRRHKVTNKNSRTFLSSLKCTSDFSINDLDLSKEL